MTTMTQVRKVAAAITGIESRVADTMVQVAADIANACQAAFGGLDAEKDDIKAIQNAVTETASWNGTSSADARRSEIKSVIRAYPYIATAAKVFKAEFGELRREHFIKLCRMAPLYETPTDAALDCVGFFEDRNDRKGGSAGRKATIGMGLGIVKNAQTRKRNEIAFRKALATLCAKHGINW